MLKSTVRRGALSLAALSGTVNAACTNYHPGPVALSAEASRDAPREVWQTHAGRTIAEPVAVAAGMIYAAGADRVVHAITLDSGHVRWGFRMTGMALGGVVRGDSSIYVASSRPLNHVIALNAATGAKRWSVDVGEPTAPLALVAGLVLVPTRKGELIALAPETGMMRWRRRIGYARSAAVPAGGDIVIASLDSLFLMSAADGHILRRRTMRGVVLGAWREAGGLLLGAMTDSTLTAIRLPDLSTAWRARLDAPAFATPTVSHDTAYIGTRIGSLYRVMLATGAPTRFATLAWPLTAGPVVFGNEFVVAGADGTVRAIDEGGRELWRIAVWRPAEVAPIPLADGILVVGGNGDFHRYVR